MCAEKDFDTEDMQTGSARDCTGLIPGVIQTDAEQEAYEELFPCLASEKKDPPDR